MPTSDVQRMHQDEWLSALRSGEYTQIHWSLFPERDDGSYEFGRKACALGVCVMVAGMQSEHVCYDAGTQEWLGVSKELLAAIVAKNDLFTRSFDEIADSFKELRDANDGDLSEWTMP